MLNGAEEDTATARQMEPASERSDSNFRELRFRARDLTGTFGIPRTVLSAWCETFSADLDGEWDHSKHASRRFSIRDAAMLMFFARLRSIGMPRVTAGPIVRRMMPVFDAVMVPDKLFAEPPIITIWRNERGWRHQLYFEAGETCPVNAAEKIVTVRPAREVRRAMEAASWISGEVAVHAPAIDGIL